MVDMKFVILAKTIHSIERQSHQEFTRGFIINNLVNIELDNCLASFVNGRGVELNKT